MIHADEPLRRSAEDDRRFVAPAAWVAVNQFFHVQQCAFLTQQLNDQIVSLENELAIQQRVSASQVAAVWPYRIGHFQAVLLADDEVIRAVAWRGVYCTGTGIQRHMFAEDCRHVEAHKRVFETHQLQIGTFAAAQHFPMGNAGALHHAFHQFGRQDQALAFNLNQLIRKFRVQRDGAVSRQRPRGGGPDNQRNRTVKAGHIKLGRHGSCVNRVESHIDRRRSFVVILNFRFRQ